MVEGAHLRNNQIPYPLGGRPTNWRTIISQKFSHRSESSELHVRLPSLGVWHWEEDCPEHLALKASGAWVQELHRTRGNRDSIHWRAHTISCVHQDPGRKQWLHRSLGQTNLLVSQGLLGRQGAAVAHCGDKDTGGRGTGEYSLAWALLEAAILAPRPGPNSL